MRVQVPQTAPFLNFKILEVDVASWTAIEGKAFVYARSGSKILWARVKAEPGKWRQQSTKTDDLAKAKEKARQIYYQVQEILERGLVVREHGKLVVTFKNVCDLYLGELQETKDSGFEIASHSPYRSVVENWFIPYFAGMALKDVDDCLIKQFEIYRRKKLGREPSKSLINTHNVVFREIFDLANGLKYIQSNEIPKFTIKGKGKKNKPASASLTRRISTLRQIHDGLGNQRRQNHNVV